MGWEEERPVEIETVRAQAHALNKLGIDPSAEGYNEKVKVLADILANPKVARFAEKITKLSDEDIDKVYEYAKLLKLAEDNN